MKSKGTDPFASRVLSTPPPPPSVSCASSSQVPVCRRSNISMCCIYNYSCSLWLFVIVEKHRFFIHFVRFTPNTCSRSLIRPALLPNASFLLPLTKMYDPTSCTGKNPSVSPFFYDPFSEPTPSSRLADVRLNDFLQELFLLAPLNSSSPQMYLRTLWEERTSGHGHWH